MGKICFIVLWLVTFSLLVGSASSTGMGDVKSYDLLTPSLPTGEKVHTPDWLNPYTAGRPEWDPYGPGSYPFLGRPEWDPFGPEAVGGVPGYGPYGSNLQLEPADPFKEGLAIKNNIPSPNQLYLQSGPLLVAQGSVMLGDTFTLWARVGVLSRFALYDYGRMVLAQSYVTPGWYKITGFYSEILGSHLYQIISAGLPSNNLSVLVNSGGYPTFYSLVGHVVDEQGNGIPGVRVIMSSSEGGTFSTVTDTFGYYGMDVATGVYIIAAEKPGYRFTQSTAKVWLGAASAARTIVGHPVSSYPASSRY